jgi:5-methylcytosine-specific restriction endonuclease McrA
MSDRPGAELQRQVARRAKGCCEYCRSQSSYAVQAFSVEHIRAVSVGGKSNFRNLALACQGCNNHKYNKQFAYDPVTSALVPLYNPRRNTWNDHFAWNDDCSLIVGLTPTGRATVQALHLNRESVVNLRHLLYAADKHPPE